MFFLFLYFLALYLGSGMIFILFLECISSIEVAEERDLRTCDLLFFKNCQDNKVSDLFMLYRPSSLCNLCIISISFLYFNPNLMLHQLIR